MGFFKSRAVKKSLIGERDTYRGNTMKIGDVCLYMFGRT